MLISSRNTEKAADCNSLCPACGEQFDCGVKSPCESSAGCWCAKIQLNERALIELQTRYQGCLCRNCLTRFAEDESLNRHYLELGEYNAIKAALRFSYYSSNLFRGRSFSAPTCHSRSDFNIEITNLDGRKHFFSIPESPGRAGYIAHNNLNRIPEWKTSEETPEETGALRLQFWIEAGMPQIEVLAHFGKVETSTLRMGQAASDESCGARAADR